MSSGRRRVRYKRWRRSSTTARVPPTFQIQISANDQTWTSVPVGRPAGPGADGGGEVDQAQFIYTIDGVQSLLPGARYVAVQRSANSTGTAELGEMRITYAPPG